MSCKVINVGVENYNSYLILSEHNILIDTVPHIYAEKLIKNISDYIEIKHLNTLIINHTECDRSGAVYEILNINPDIEVIATLAGLKNLEQQLNKEFNQKLAKSNMVYSVSDDISLKFIITHNINWPDSMMTYCIEDKILFSCDAFSNEKETKKEYFSKHLSHLADYVLTAMQQLKKLDISRICPGSGDELSDTKIIDEYISWSTENNTNSQITILYSSESENTKLLADYAATMIKKPCLINIDKADDEEIYKQINASKGVIFGSYTRYRNIPKRMCDIVCGINQYKISDTVFAAFGSYGWSGEATNLIYSMLKARHFNTYKSPFRVMFKPTEKDFDEFNKYLTDFINQLD